MSIIVKGMEMPRTCSECDLCECRDLDSMPSCRITGTSFCQMDWKTVRQPDCPIVEVPEWISVEDRLPEIDMNVLVYAIGKIDGFIGDTVIAISRRCVFRLFPWNEGIEVWENPWQYFTTDYEVTHWIPLPEPPKEGTIS